MKSLTLYYLVILIAIIVLSCDGSPKAKSGHNMVPENINVKFDSLYPRDITGERTEIQLNDAFIESIVLNILEQHAKPFTFLKPHYFLTAGYSLDIARLNGKVSMMKTDYYDGNPYNSNNAFDATVEIMFDEQGLCKSYVERNKYNTSERTYQIEYLSYNPIKIKSIIAKWDQKDNTSKVFPITYNKYSFVYDDKEILQSIERLDSIFYPTKNDFKNIKRGQYSFSYYEKGVAVNLDFYSFMESEPSIPYEVYYNGKLHLKRIFDKNGRQLLLSEKNDTIGILDKNNKPLRYGETFFDSNSERFNSLHSKYIEFDSNGNWISKETTGSNRDNIIRYIKREISYYKLSSFRDKDPNKFLKSFFDLYEKDDNQLTDYIESDIGLYLTMMDEYNPQGHPELTSFPKVIDLMIPSESVFNTTPKNEYSGYSECKDGFYYKEIEASDLPSFFGKNGLMQELASSKILEVKLVQKESLIGEFCFVMVDNIWYLFYQGFYDL